MKGLWKKVGAFIFGFTIVYVALGIAMGLLGSLIGIYIKWLYGISGAVLILFGLYTLGLFRNVQIFGKQAKAIDKVQDPKNIIGTVLVGMAFAIGWSPCTGPILAAILTLAASQSTVLQAGILLIAFCAGLSIPFVATAFAVGKTMAFFTALQNKHMRKIEIGSAVILIAAGVLFLTSMINNIRGFGIDLGFIEKALRGGIEGGLSPVAILFSMAGGLFSFISPCVLPLFPVYLAMIAGTSDLDSLDKKEA